MHDAGLTGTGVTVAVLDTAINPAVPTLADADIVLHDAPDCVDGSSKQVGRATTDDAEAWHGTNVISMIVGSGAGYPGQAGVKGIAPGAKLLAYALGPEDSAAGVFYPCTTTAGDLQGGIHAMAVAINDAIDSGANIISISAGSDSSPELDDAIARAVHEGVVVVAGLRNITGKLVGDFPGESNGVVSVQAVDVNGSLPTLVPGGSALPDPLTDVCAPGLGVLLQGTGFVATMSWQDQTIGGGTSTATPVVAGLLALVKQKYPLATGNQLIQTLIHNTGTQEHELLIDPSNGFGYGTVSGTRMLAVDPTQYPDVNPLISDEPTAEPTADEIASWSAPTSDAPSKPGDSPDDAAPSWLVPLMLVGLVGLLVLIGVIVLVVVLTARSRRARLVRGPHV